MKRTKIEWCDHTFNAFTGCTRISPACDNCYAADIAKRFPHAFGSWEPGAPRKRTSAAYWRQPLAWDREARKYGNSHSCAAGVRRRVFCNSMSDVFDNQVPESWRRDLFKLIDATPNLDWLLLTKRPQNIAKMMPRQGCASDAYPLPNVWLGVTAETQQEHDRRVPILRSITCRVKFIEGDPQGADFIVSAPVD